MTGSHTVYLETMGCQMNALDSELAFGELAARGYRLTEDMAAAHLVVLNTCSVRQHAEDKVYSRLGSLKGTHRRESEQIIAVIGCMAERDGDGPLDKMPHVDILCGPSELHQLPGLIEDVRATRRPAVALTGRLRGRSTSAHSTTGHDDLESLDSGRLFGPANHPVTPKVFGRRQAYVRITRGCNKHCTYCVVPATRGPERHRHPDRIVEEVRRLADAGVVEVTLLGQTVNHYRHRPDAGDASGATETSFAQLLRRVHDEVPQLPRLRFVTNYPRDFSDAALEVMASSPRICKYLHLPAQSGSNEVLKRMNRGHTVEAYLGLLDRARALMPNLSIAGDMIVGFSGETEADFQASLDLLRRARYKNCFVFKYSTRPGTAADDRLPDDVPDKEKRRRNNDMLAVQAEVSLSLHRAMLGRVVEVLVEGPSKSAIKAQESEQSRGAEVGRAGDALRNQLVGRTDGDHIVVFDGQPGLIGRFASVVLQAATPYTLHGRLAGALDGGDGARAIPLAVGDT